MTVVAGANRSGYAYVSHAGGIDSMAGFTFIPDVPVITSFSPAMAGRGATVIIKGSHFAGASQVYFGNTPVTGFTITADSTISAIVGRGASGYVRIVTVNGTDSMSGFIYNPVLPVISSFSPTAVREGDQVTIKGSNFTGTTSVTFGGVPATFAVVSDSVISVLAGAGATGKVMVIGPDGADSLGGFTYTGTTVDGFSPAVGGKGAVVTIKGTNMRNAYSVSFGGILATAFTVLSDTSMTATVSTGATGAVKVSTPQGSGSRNGFLWILPPVINSYTPTVGDVGDTIRVNGKYFTYTDSVVFGGTRATWFKIINDTSLVAVLTTGSSGDVNVISGGGIGTKTGFVFKTAPIITSYTPVTAPAGTTVSISGVRFGNTPADNIVYFGAVKANVLSATNTNLTVQVPYGATYAPISVTANGGTAYTAKDFTLTFKGGDTAFTQNSFAPKVELITPAANMDGVIIDIFEDGKPDLVTGSTNPATIAMYKNTSPAGALTFDTRKNFAANLDVLQLAVNDFNGDGKPDLAATSGADGRPVAVYLNTTTNGNVTLNPGLILTNNSVGNNTLASTDADNDGKPDIIALTFYFGALPVYRNTSTGNSLSFEQPYPTGPSIDKGLGLCFKDIDMDGKQDLVVFYALSFSVYRNIGPKGYPLFAAGVNYRTNMGSLFEGGIVAGDIDGDGMPDVAAATANALSIFRNISKPGTISFEAVKNYATPGYSVDVSIGDLNGDGKPDFVVCNKDPKNVSLYKNSSTPGKISLEAKVDYAVGDNPKNTAICDLDADGKPELVVFGTSYVSIFKNQMNFIPPPVISSFTPNSAYTGTIVTIKGQDLTSATSVKFGGTAATSFSVVSDSVITAVVGTGATGDVIVANAVGSDTLAGFNFVIPVPIITSFTPASGTTGTVVNIKGGKFNGASSVKLGGTDAASFIVVSDSVITATVGTGATGEVEVITQYGRDTLSGFTFVTPVVKPVISSFTPTSGTNGTLVTIKGSQFTGTTAVSFGGTTAASFSVVSDSVITAIIGTGATGAVQITTLNSTDTLSGFTYNSDNQQPVLTVAPNPAKDYVIVSHPGSLNAQIKVIDMYGNIVQNVKVNPNVSNTRLALNGVKQGVYIISWSDGGDSLNQLILIQ
jgi:hypothetical protein